MEIFKKHTGQCAPIFEQNIDTDQIVPKKFLLKTERTGFDEALFYDWRFLNDGSVNEKFVLNAPKYKEASILLAGANFGCGSSREHAPWALLEYGFRVIIAPFFADIFYNNCFKIGLLPIELKEDLLVRMVKNTENSESYLLNVDLENRVIFDQFEINTKFQIDDFRRFCLLNGLDDIELTLQHEDKIKEYEKRPPF